MRKQKFCGNIFVANLPDGFTDEQLAQAFDPYGIVIGAFLARDPASGAPRNHGLVNIAPERAAAPAVAAMDGTEIGGKRIKAKLADPNMSLTIPTRPGASGPGSPFGRSSPAEREARPAYAARSPSASGAPSFARTAPAARPSFQVERRPLPRRV